MDSNKNYVIGYLMKMKYGENKFDIDSSNKGFRLTKSNGLDGIRCKDMAFDKSNDKVSILVSHQESHRHTLITIKYKKQDFSIETNDYSYKAMIFSWQLA